MTARFFFFHNPKAAGTSIISAISTAHPEATISPNVENSIDDHARLEGNFDRFLGFDIYAGHYGRDAFEALKDGHAYFSNFRHPVDRIVSLYNYFRRIPFSDELLSQPQYAAVKACKESSFDDFCSNDQEEIRIYTANAHSRQLTKSFYEIEDSIDLRELYDFIDGMACVFVSEYAQHSALWLKEVFQLHEIPRENVVSDSDAAARTETLSRRTYKRIIEINEKDLGVYRHAVDRLFSRQ